jgi:voltage-gated potassium channel
MTRSRNQAIFFDDSAEFTRKFRIFLTLSISLFVVSTLVVAAVKHYSLGDSIVYSLEALAFMIHEESGFMRGFQIFMATFGGFLLWWILWSLFDVIFESSFTEYLFEIKTHKRLKKMKNHYIIVGGGRVGDGLANRLSLEKKEFIIIEKDAQRLKDLKKEKFIVIKGDSSELESLKRAKIEQAKCLIITSPETERNLLIMLVAKELNPNIEIFVRGDNQEVVNILEKAGAKKVVIPEIATVDQFMIDLEAADKKREEVKPVVKPIAPLVTK